MVDSVDLALFEDLPDVAIELECRLQIAAKRFFNDDPPPAAVLLGCQSGGSKALDHGPEELRSRGEVEKAIAFRLVVSIDPRRQFLQLFVGARFLEIACQVIKTLFETVPQ